MNITITEAQAALMLNTRIEKGWTQWRLAKESGISRHTIHNLETRKHVVFFEMIIVTLVRTLDLSWPEFLALNPDEDAFPSSI